MDTLEAIDEHGDHFLIPEPAAAVPLHIPGEVHAGHTFGFQSLRYLLGDQSVVPPPAGPVPPQEGAGPQPVKEPAVFPHAVVDILLPPAVRAADGPVRGIDVAPGESISPAAVAVRPVGDQVPGDLDLAAADLQRPTAARREIDVSGPAAQLQRPAPDDQFSVRCGAGPPQFKDGRHPVPVVQQLDLTQRNTVRKPYGKI